MWLKFYNKNVDNFALFDNAGRNIVLVEKVHSFVEEEEEHLENNGDEDKLIFSSPSSPWGERLPDGVFRNEE